MKILDTEEKVLNTFKKHSFYIIFEIFLLGVFAILPLILFLFTDLIKAEKGTGLFSLLVFLYLVFISIFWTIAFYAWTNYYLDIWILTNKRLISVDQKGFFSREVSILRLDKIQDVSIVTKGAINTILRIGDIKVQSAGTDNEFIMRGIRNPIRVKDIIFEAQTKQIDAIKTVRIAK